MIEIKQTELRHYLIQLAQMGAEPVTYSQVASHFKQRIRGDGDARHIGQLLGRITEEEDEAGRPLLSVLVINQELNLPGHGFYELAQRLGRYRGKGELGKIEFFATQLQAVHRYWETVNRVPFRGGEISDKAVHMALQGFDRAYKNSNDFEQWLERGHIAEALVYGGRFYPPAHVVQAASGEAGVGEAEAKEVLQALGFRLIETPLERPFSTYLLTWNPQNWGWPRFDPLYEQLLAGGRPLLRWSCGRTKKIAVGDRVYLMRLGSMEPTGILAAGWVTEAPVSAPHWSGEAGREALYIHFEPEALLDPNQDRLLDPTAVNEAFTWRPQSSGITIPPLIAAQLDTAWQEHLVAPQRSPQREKTKGAFQEGKKIKTTSHRYERDPKARQACIDHYGAVCQACGFDFGAVYGVLGAGYIQVHHITPLAVRDGPYEVDPITDLVPLCANCHVMVHRPEKTLTVPELKAILER